MARKRGLLDIFRDVAGDIFDEVLERIEERGTVEKKTTKPKKKVPSPKPASKSTPKPTNRPGATQRTAKEKKEVEGFMLPEAVIKAGKKFRIAEAVEYKDYRSNPHVDFQSEEKGGHYLLKYSFKDHKNKSQTFSIIYKLTDMEDMAGRFGFPRSFVGTFKMTRSKMEQWKQARDTALAKGLFMLEGNILRPDPSGIVSYYAETFCEQIASQIVHALGRYATDNRRERIEMAMKFVQDIPYAIPFRNDPKTMYGGVITPPQILYLKYGDCDSKSFLFAGILTYLIPHQDIAFLTVPGHLLTIIREAKPEKGMRCITYKGESYVLAETAGPARNNFGVPSQYKEGKTSVHKLSYTGKNSIIPYTKQAQRNIGLKGYHIYKAPQKRVDIGIIEQLKTLQEEKAKIKSIVFNDDGGWLIVANKNDYYAYNVPNPLTSALQQMKERDIEVTDIALSYQDEFVIIYHNGYGFSGQLQEQTNNSLIPTMNTLTEKYGHPIKDVVFTHHKTPRWVMLYGKKNTGFTGDLTPSLEKHFREVVEKLGEKGMKSVAFTQKNYWVMLFDKNEYAMYLPKKQSTMIKTVMKQLREVDASADRIYFTPTDDWIIIYNDSQFVASFQE